MALFYATLAAILGGTISYLALMRIAMPRGVARNNLNTGAASVRKYPTALAALVNKVLPQPKEVGDKLRRRIASAGLSITPATYHGLSVVFYVTLLGFLAPIMSFLDIQPTAKIALIVVIVALVLLCPRGVLAIKTRRRREQIKVALPRALDLLAISVEAGLTPHRAIRIVAQKSTGVLAHEFELADRDMVLLRYSLPEALERMANRCGVEALSQFVAALSAGTAVGASVGDVLKNQSKHVFKRRSQELKALANKLGMKMILPIGFLMLPNVLFAFAAPIAISMIAKMAGVQ